MYRLSLQSSISIRSQIFTVTPRIYRSRKLKANNGRILSSSATTAKTTIQAKVHYSTSANASTSSSRGRSHISHKKFRNLDISPELKAYIRHEYMSKVQAATLEPALSGRNLLVHAETGAGKTLAFLLPAVERLLRNPVKEEGELVPILVISPTRELALQVEHQVRDLYPRLRIRSVTPGDSKGSATLERFANFSYDIVIATPGPLHAYFTGPLAEQVKAKFTELQTLILDDVDRLLDGSFSRELEAVIRMLPSTTRQNLFFSATKSDKVKFAAQKYTPSGEYDFITTEANTHLKVHQSFIITPFRKHLPTLLALLYLDGIKHTLPTPSLSSSSTSPAPKLSSKVVVFFPTPRQASFASEVFSASAIKDSLPTVYTLHSRMSQSARTEATKSFKESRNAILLCNDLTARGVDFPGVTLVIEVGIPQDSTQYIVHLERIARAGAEGQITLILDPAEEVFIKSGPIRLLDLVPYATSPTSHKANELMTYTQTFRQHVTVARDAIVGNKPEMVENAYREWLGYYNGKAQMLRWNKEELVRKALSYAVEAMGWKKDVPPTVEARAADKMGLGQMPGLNIELPPETFQRRIRQSSHNLS